MLIGVRFVNTLSGPRASGHRFFGRFRWGSTPGHGTALCGEGKLVLSLYWNRRGFQLCAGIT
jgi:hypothetical protein